MCGSYTIETALVYPIILFVVLFIINSAFYMHNRMVMQETAYETAIYGSTLERTDGNEMKQKMQEKYQRSINQRLISMKNTNATIEVKSGKIIVRIQGRMYTAGIGWLPDFHGTVISVQKSINLLDPIAKIRIARMFEQIRKE